MKPIKLPVILVLVLLTVASSARAQQCVNGYDRPDRQTVVSRAELPKKIFSRLAYLAEYSAGPSLSLTQRMALNNEFQALKAALTDYGDKPVRGISRRSNRFLGDVIDSTYLNLGPAILTGQTIEEAQANSRNALDSVNNATGVLLICLWGSWEHYQGDTSPNGKMCGGGYAKSDSRVVMREYREGQAILAEMYAIAKIGSDGVFSTVQRKLNNFDFEYLKEDLNLFGDKFRFGIERQTRIFFDQVFDTTYLGLNAATVDGPFVLQAQTNSVIAMGLLEEAMKVLKRCIDVRP